MKKSITCAMYLAFIFTGVWLMHAKAPVLKEDPWVITIRM